MDKLRVVLLFGGRSSEHSISCATAGGVLRAIDRDRYDVIPVGITRDGAFVLEADDPERFALDPEHLPEVVGQAGGAGKHGRRLRPEAHERGRQLESGQALAAHPRGRPHRIAQAHVLATKDVGLADTAPIERSDDAGRHVLDIHGRDPKVTEGCVGEGPIVGSAQLLADA